MHSKTLSIFVCSVTILIATGCTEETLPTIDTSSAEFASPQDYSAYDQEMTLHSAGQAE